MALYQSVAGNNVYNPILIARYTYDAWGNLLSVTNSNGAPITSTSSIAIRNPFRYRGYHYDTDTGFYYLQSRYYDPAVGRFINADAFASTGQGLLGYNMFVYCGNNPVNRADPWGYAPRGFRNDIVVIEDGDTGRYIPRLAAGSVRPRIPDEYRSEFSKDFEDFVVGFLEVTEPFWEAVTLWDDTKETMDSVTNKVSGVTTAIGVITYFTPLKLSPVATGVVVVVGALSTLWLYGRTEHWW